MGLKLFNDFAMLWMLSKKSINNKTSQQFALVKLSCLIIYHTFLFPLK